MNRSKFVYLDITSWAGLSLGAQHYYAELQSGGDEPSVKLTRILTPHQAAKANRYRSSDGFLRVRAGDESDGFDEKDEIYKLALKVWQKCFPQGEILLEGRSSVGDPLKVLACPSHPETINIANGIWDEFEAIEGWQYKKNWSKAKAISDRWNTLICTVVAQNETA